MKKVITLVTFFIRKENIKPRDVSAFEEFLNEIKRELLDLFKYKKREYTSFVYKEFLTREAVEDYCRVEITHFTDELVKKYFPKEDNQFLINLQAEIDSCIFGIIGEEIVNDITQIYS